MNTFSYFRKPVGVIFVTPDRLTIPIRHKAWKMKVRSGSGMACFFHTGSIIQANFYKDHISDIIYSSIVLNDYDNIDYTPFLSHYGLLLEHVTIYGSTDKDVVLSYPVQFSGIMRNIKIHGISTSEMAYVKRLFPTMPLERIHMMYDRTKTLNENINRLLSYLKSNYGYNQVQLLTTK